MNKLPTKDEIIQWLKTSGVTRKELADKMCMNYSALCSVLNGTNPLSEKRADAIARVMAEHDKQVRAKLHPEVQVKVEAWAKMMHAEIDKVVEMVIAHTLGVDLNAEKTAPPVKPYGSGSGDDGRECQRYS